MRLDYTNYSSQHARAIQIEVVNEAWPRDNAMDGISISSSILTSVSAAIIASRDLSDDPENRFDHVEQEERLVININSPDTRKRCCVIRKFRLPSFFFNDITTTRLQFSLFVQKTVEKRSSTGLVFPIPLR